MKKLDIKAFRELGYLQEVNRQFFHPLGLALELTENEDGVESISGVWDCREDPEGVYFAIKDQADDKFQDTQSKADFVQSERDKRKIDREARLGFDIEPIVQQEGGSVILLEKLNSECFLRENYEPNWWRLFGLGYEDSLNDSVVRIVLKTNAVGYCEGGSVGLRPKAYTYAVMFEVDGEQFWFHVLKPMMSGLIKEEEG